MLWTALFSLWSTKKALRISVISVIYKIHSANLFLYSTCIIMLRITSSFPCSKDISPIYILATRRMLFKPIPCSLPDLVVSGKSLSPKLSWPQKLFFMVIIKILFFRKEEMLIYGLSPLTFSIQLFKALFMITLKSNAFNFVFCG